MRYDAFRWWVLALAAALALPAAVLVAIGSEHSSEGETESPPGLAKKPPAKPPVGAAKTPPVSAKPTTSADAPPAPTITAVMPAAGKPGHPVLITLRGTGFNPDAKDAKVTFGPQGASAGASPIPSAVPAAGGAPGLGDDECKDVKVLSDTMLQCTLSSEPKAGEPQRFTVTMTIDGKKRSSEASVATYTFLRRAEDGGVISDAKCGSLGCLNPPGQGARAPDTYAMVHLRGRRFDVPDGGTLKVFFTPAGEDCKKSIACDPLMVLNPRELVCYLPQAIYARRSTVATEVDDQFTVVRPGEGYCEDVQ